MQSILPLICAPKTVENKVNTISSFSDPDDQRIVICQEKIIFVNKEIMFKVFEGSMKYWSVPLKNYTESDTHFKP